MNGQTQLVGIFGWPVAHSKSPAMHNAAFKHLAMNWAYVPLPVKAQSSFADAVKGLSACGFRGANVTVPYKEEALLIADELSDEAKKIGAVNTLVFKEDGTVRGENTDAFGFLAHLKEQKVDLAGKTTTVVGAGGASRAIVYALFNGGASRVMVINRNKARAEEMSKNFGIEALDWSDPSFREAAKASIIVNTTSLGLHEGDDLPWPVDLSFSPSQLVYDAIYKETPLVKKARNDGASALSGAGMLLWQGKKAFEIWTGVEAPVDVMKRELDNA